MGSIPIRATGMDQVVQLADTRRSERRAFGRGSSTLPLVTAEWTGAWFPARSHKPFDAGSNPASAILRLRFGHAGIQRARNASRDGRGRKAAKRPGREPGDRLWGRLPP